MKARTASELAAWAGIPPSLATLALMGASLHGMTIATIRLDGRQPKALACRQWIAKQARSQGFSYPQIGRALNRDHTTIIHAVRCAISVDGAVASQDVSVLHGVKTPS